MNENDRSCLKQKTQMFKAEENLDDLKYKGKPFYWVDEKRLKMLKKVFET